MAENKVLELVNYYVAEKLGEDIITLDFRQHSPFVDYFVIASARNEPHAASIMREVEAKLEEAGYEIRINEQVKGSQWFLLESEGVVLHLFWGEARSYYGLEDLWKDLRI